MEVYDGWVVKLNRPWIFICWTGAGKMPIYIVRFFSPFFSSFPLKNHLNLYLRLLTFLKYSQKCISGKRKWKKFWDYKTPKPHKIKYSQMVKITDHRLSMRTRVYSSKRIQHLFFFLLSFSLYRSFHPLVHDYVWGLHWDLQMFCVWNLGKRSQRRL